MIDAVSGSTLGRLSLSQTADAGSGGYSENRLAGHGGSALSSLTYSDANAQDLAAVVRAVGGRGGRAGAGSGHANGGDAMASLTLNSSRQGSLVNGEARAEGGNATGTGLGGAARAVIAVSGEGHVSSVGYASGGLASPGRAGAASAEVAAISTQRGGSARAEATALGATHQSDALARADLGAPGRAEASAHGDGSAGRALAQAGVQGGAGRSVSASAHSDVSGQTDSHARAVMGGSLDLWLDPIAPAAGLGAFSYVVAGSGESGGASAGMHARPDVQLVPSVIGHGRMGAGYGGAASGVRSYSASAVFTFTQEARSELVLGMLDFTANGRGDDFTLRFSVTHFDTTLLEHSFSGLSAAESWFADQTLHLGTFEGETEIGLHLTLTGDFAQSADFSYMLSAPVPEPTSAALMLAGIALLRFMARWRSAQQSSPDPEDWTS
ncbi:hypothetical protein [Methyloversatilis sp. XJ19-49]|uniref:hypothetical protein n=1 Tax=Methyloversatilis sp. XJ19-49 TaxID=2963429 RepID=UPI00211C576F|nr:hypothetical protein [Methyloversatilis sp. XJ19-49]MCQ9378021.1 hypothetical protein [Methyloversatilis sp. XJ19-49]